MSPSPSYELLDFGDGRRLERFGTVVLDRPCPAAEGAAKRTPSLWRRADARFERGEGDRGQWSLAGEAPQRWQLDWEGLTFELKRTEFGHLGIFPEQAANWQWIAGKARQAAPPLTVLNLFAYTGGSTLAAALGGARVTHLDAAKNVVAWARRNAELSGLVDAPIRWIADDARKFVARELKRGKAYDAVILDPPTYGHGIGGEVWQLERDLPALLDDCARLTEGRRRFILLSCHTPGYDPPQLVRLLGDAFGTSGANITAAPMLLRSSAGADLPSGVAARWEKR